MILDPFIQTPQFFRFWFGLRPFGQRLGFSLRIRLSAPYCANEPGFSGPVLFHFILKIGQLPAVDLADDGPNHGGADLGEAAGRAGRI
jgi:hypothetical protein